ncbi:MAG: TIGR00730 family Rossman fold protein [Alphaproteobacteria bacterium]
MTTVRSLCVYCGSSSRVAPHHFEAASRLGAILAQRRIRLIFGGGHVGLMGLMADAALAGGGEVIGVIPDFIEDLEVAHPDVTELVVVDSMHARKQKMFELADAFAVLPGGLGTLDETLEIITWKQLNIHDKPIVLVDVEGYWAPLRGLIDKLVDEGFAGPDALNFFTVVTRVEDVLPALARAPELAIEPEPSHI